MENEEENLKTRRNLVKQYKSDCVEAAAEHKEELNQLLELQKRELLTLQKKQNNEEDLLHLNHVKKLTLLDFRIRQNSRIFEEEASKEYEQPRRKYPT